MFDSTKRAKELNLDVSKVRRLEIIDHKIGGTGRIYTARPCTIDLSLQDDGKTLKIFVLDPPVGG